MRLFNAILIKICLGFILGIYFGFQDVLTLNVLSYLSLVLTIALTVFLFFRQFKVFFLSLSIILFCVLGALVTQLKLPENQPKHITHLDFSALTDVTLKAQISEELRPNDFSYKYILDDLEIDGQAYTGKILWQVSKDVDISEIRSGQGVICYGQLNSFQNAKNPQVFDYVNFMKNRNVYGVIYEDFFDLLPQQAFSWKAFGAAQRYKVVKALKRAGFKDEHLQLIQALILGQKQAIDKETYRNFAEVGVVHILAVSGLHVGIVLIIIQFLLKPLRRIPKHGKTLLVIFSIIGIWFFALLAGFSPSVMRASTMFTFLALGQLNRRKTNSVNMLCLSAMVLLLFRPQLIFEVGFQLSYAAVFAIIMLYPVFSKVYQPELKVLKIFTDTAYLSLAAQIGVLPFQLYYFHQFPGLFLIGNLVIIPFLGVLLFGGIFCITLALFGTLSSFFVEVYSYVLDLLLNYVDWLSQFEEFIFKDLFFTQSMFLTSILSVITFMVMMREFRKSRIILFLVSILSFLMLSVFEISNIQSNTELVIFHKTGRTLLGVKQAEKLKVYSDSISRQENSYLIKNYSLLNRVKQTKTEALKNIYKLQEQRLIVIDSSGIYASNPKGQIVALSGSPEVHLGKLIQALKPKQIIADGNNYKSYVERWRKTSRKHGVSFYSTYENGAISFKLD